VAAIWRIYLFGGLSVEGIDGVAPASVNRFRTRRAASLLAYLALQGRSVRREALAELLWPGEDVEKTRRRLRTELHWLRAKMEPEGVARGAVVAASGDEIGLVHHSVETDVAEFEALIKTAGSRSDSRGRIDALKQAVDLYRGDLLPRFDDDWFGPIRTRMNNKFVDAARALSQELKNAGQIAAALDTLLKGIEADSHDEALYREAMRLYMEIGQPNRARRLFRALAETLKNDVNAEPSAETRELCSLAGAGPAATA
jgi:DNA-binding SARP family transcriptional activator